VSLAPVAQALSHCNSPGRPNACGSMSFVFKGRYNEAVDSSRSRTLWRFPPREPASDAVLPMKWPVPYVRPSRRCSCAQGD